MYDIQKQQKQLPDTLPDLARFVLIGREKLNAVRAEIRAIQKVGLAKEVHDQKLLEAQEIAEAVLDAEVKVGELTAEIPKATKGTGSNQFQRAENRNVAEFSKSKSEQLKSIGIKQDTAERFEHLARHPEAVEQAKREARQNGEVVTRQKALDIITKSHQRKPPAVKAREEHEDFQQKKQEQVIEFREAVRDRNNMDILAMDFTHKCGRVRRVAWDLYLEITEDDSTPEIVAALTEEQRIAIDGRIKEAHGILDMIKEVVKKNGTQKRIEGDRLPH